MTNHAFYDSPATARDYLTHAATAGELRICDWLAQRPGPLLDVGCGAGRLHEKLVNVSGGLTGVDYAAEPLRIYRQRYGDANVVQGDALRLPFQDAQFGLALMGYHMIESILPSSSREKALLEAARVLKPGGFLVLSRHNRLGYKLVQQIHAYLRRPGSEFGDLCGPSRVLSDPGPEEAFKMHVCSTKKIRLAARRAGFNLTDSWDFDTAGRTTIRCRAVVECFVLQGRPL
ncbi:methyltransferase domain-containing protein [Arthrobacter sp. PAMC25284]|nr:methyltransferase domain-containing protein [Arthrobacter sp. PAMC25284]